MRVCWTELKSEAEQLSSYEFVFVRTYISVTYCVDGLYVFVIFMKCCVIREQIIFFYLKKELLFRNLSKTKNNE